MLHFNLFVNSYVTNKHEAKPINSKSQFYLHINYVFHFTHYALMPHHCYPIKYSQCLIKVYL